MNLTNQFGANTRLVTRYPETPSQTGGPYVHIGLAPQQAGFDIFEKNFDKNLVSDKTIGERITVQGRVFDGSGTPVKDALLEIWQANAAGKYAHRLDPQDKTFDSAFLGWGRTGADFETGDFEFETIKPGSVEFDGRRVQAPHICFVIFARGINVGLHTRLYFDDEDELNAVDPILSGIELPTRRDSLIGRRRIEGGKTIYAFDIRLQDTPDGGSETVFFDI
ncbi:protocatechuate 3,4-dioxygenase subunit alpha [Rhodococcus qingshengii]|uniref:protocatechuate 3,4-dioxygenase subunit alpha n=1 Tax=Rhodococcus qingshengii TaxID=334542 RepID=UPI003019E884